MVMLHHEELQMQVPPLHLRVTAGLMMHLLSVLLPASPALLPGHCVIVSLFFVALGLNCNETSGF